MKTLDLRIMLVAGITLAVAAFLIVSGGIFSQQTAFDMTNSGGFLKARLSKDTIMTGETTSLEVTVSGNPKSVSVFFEGKTVSEQCAQDPCNAVFPLSFEEKGVHFVEASAVFSGETITQRIVVRVLEAGQSCIDGTVFSECSKTRPFYCEEGTLAENCQKCGCPESFECTQNKCAPKTAKLVVFGMEEENVFSLEQNNVKFWVALSPESEKALKGTEYSLAAVLLGNGKSFSVQKSFSLSKDVEVHDAAASDYEIVEIEFDGEEIIEGTYSLEVTVFSEKEQSAKTFENALTVKKSDSTPPQAPSWAGWSFSGTAVLLNWNAVPDEDIMGYKLFESVEQNPAFITYSLKEAFGSATLSALIEGPENGKHFFVLKAFDWYGNESEYSEVLEIDI